MKKLLFSLFLLSLGLNTYSQTKKFACYYDGYWSEWRSFSAKLNGNYNGFIIYSPWEHPSNYYFSFEIDYRTPPTKKEVKEHFKKKEWWEYRGTVEYYVCDVYPTIKDCLKQYGRPLMKSDVESDDYNGKLSVLRASRIRQQGSFVPRGLTKRTASATIKIAPYSHKTLRPKVYNIWFEGIGFGIDMDNSYFQDRY